MRLLDEIRGFVEAICLENRLDHLRTVTMDRKLARQLHHPVGGGLARLPQNASSFPSTRKPCRRRIALPPWPSTKSRNASAAARSWVHDRITPPCSRRG